MAPIGRPPLRPGVTQEQRRSASRIGNRPWGRRQGAADDSRTVAPDGIASQLRAMADAMRRRADALAAARVAAQGATDDRSSDISGASDTEAKDLTGDAPDRP